MFPRDGGLAQLGERLTGSQEVSGSIPLISTKKTCFRKKTGLFLRSLVFESDKKDTIEIFAKVLITKQLKKVFRDGRLNKKE